MTLDKPFRLKAARRGRNNGCSSSSSSPWSSSAPISPPKPKVAGWVWSTPRRRGGLLGPGTPSMMSAQATTAGGGGEGQEDIDHQPRIRNYTLRRRRTPSSSDGRGEQEAGGGGGEVWKPFTLETLMELGVSKDQASKIVPAIEDQAKKAQIEMEIEALKERLLPVVSDELFQGSVSAYQNLSLLHGAAAVAIVAILLVDPSLLVSPTPLLLNPEHAPPLANAGFGATSVLYGLLAAAFLRSASVLSFLQTSVSVGEMCSWRHQRQCLALGVASLLLAVIQVAHLGYSTLLASALVLAVSIPTAIGCFWSSRGAFQTGEIFTWTTEWSDPGFTIERLWGCVRRDFSTLGGFILLCIMAVSLKAVLPVLFTTLMSAGTFGGQYAGVRALVGVPCMLAQAALAHELLEDAQLCDVKDPIGAITSSFIDLSVKSSAIDSAVNPPPERYYDLNLMSIFSMGLQMFFLSKVYSWGAEVNLDPCLWGPIYISTLLTLAFHVCRLFGANWEDVFVNAPLTAVLRLSEFVKWITNGVLWPRAWRTSSRFTNFPVANVESWLGKATETISMDIAKKEAFFKAIGKEKKQMRRLKAVALLAERARQIKEARARAKGEAGGGRR